MNYPRLTELLTKLGEINLEVDHVLILKVGCVRFSEFKGISQSSHFPISEMEELIASEDKKSRPPNNWHAVILEALKKHPNLFDISVIDEDHAAYLSRYNPPCRIVTKSLFSLRVDLPERLQKYRSEYPLEKKPIERFQVVSNGSLFAAFAEIMDYPVWTHIGHEYRELLRGQIEKETSYKCPLFGPSPIHPDIYVVFRKNPPEVQPAGMKVYFLKEEIFLVVDAGSQTDLDIATAIFKHIEFPMVMFYSAEMVRCRLMEYYQEILNRFSQLSNVIKELIATPWWRFLKSTKLSYVGKTTLSQIHTRLVEFETELLSYNRKCSQLLEQIKEHRILSAIHQYFHNHTEPDTTIPDAVCKALDHYEGELQTFGNIRSVVVASLVGAAIGAVLTVVLTQIL